MAKLSAKERIEFLLDPGSFEEIQGDVTFRAYGLSERIKPKQGDGVLTGFGKIQGRNVFIYSQDSSYVGGSLGEAHGRKILRLLELAERHLCPVIGIVESGGARIHEGVLSLAAYADIFYKNVQISGVVPQITIILGACAGGAVYSPALTDFILASKDAFMFLTGPEVVSAVTGETLTKEELGGAVMHDSTSGIIDLLADDDESTLLAARSLLMFLPQNYREIPERLFTSDSPNRETESFELVSQLSPDQPYNVLDLIKDLVDEGRFFEIKPNFGKSLVTGFGTLDGIVVGIVANQPKELAGCLDINSSVKGARFVRICNSFNIPLIVLVDVPGFLPGSEQERGGVIKHGAKLLFAFSEAKVPRITLILKKAYGGAYDVMNSKHIGADFVFALPNSEIAVMGPEAAVKIIFRKELNDSPEKLPEFIKKYKHDIASVRFALELGFVDKLIQPKESRATIIKALKSCKNRAKNSPIPCIPL